MHRVIERLEAATLHFARSGGIKERLEAAWRQCLQNLDAEDVPHDLRLQFLELSSQLQRERPLRGEDALRATIRKMSSEEAERHASLIVRMFCRVTRQTQLDLPMPAGNGASVVQLFGDAR